jgi:hypothetical protein
MQNRKWIPIAAFAAAFTLVGGAPVHATDFTLFGSYWDTDVAGDAAGGGVSLGIPFNEMLALELRATYYEELTDDPLENIFDSDDPVFQEVGIQALPLEAGLRLSFAEGATFRPHVMGGVSYYLLDSDFGEIGDEVGWFGAVGATIGDGDGAEFYVEGLYRKAEAEIELDPDDLEDIDDLEIGENAQFDMDGFGVNLGVRWSF